MLFIDFAKAYDSIDHKRLQFKLEQKYINKQLTKNELVLLK